MYRIVLPLTFVVALACQPAASPLTEGDKAAIRAEQDAWVTAITSGDMDALAALYTEDVVVLPPNEPAVEGQAALLAWMEGYPPASAAALSIVSIDGYADLAVVRGTYTMTLTPEGVPEPIHDQGKFIEIRRRQADGSWLMAMDIFNSDLPLPSPEQ